MNSIKDLQRLGLLVRFGGADWKCCVDWAIERLRNDDEGDDLDVVLLAAATREDEVRPLLARIIERYLGPGAFTDTLAAGKLIVELFASFQAGKETAVSLEHRLWRLFYKLGQPSWLVMLARNCEYATDVPAFEKPFQDELQYIASLWANAETEADFMAQYDPKVSKSHDAV